MGALLAPLLGSFWSTFGALLDAFWSISAPGPAGRPAGRPAGKPSVKAVHQFLSRHNVIEKYVFECVPDSFAPVAGRLGAGLPR